MKKTFFILCSFLTLLIGGCGFHLQNDAAVPEQFKTLVFVSSDPYGQLSREVKTVLANNQVNIVKQDDKKHYPVLQIQSSRLTKDTVSVYQDGKAAESQLILRVDAQVIIANRDIYPITVKVFRSFFDNPATALAKSTEELLIENEMYKQAATQLINRLQSINESNLRSSNEP